MVAAGLLGGHGLPQATRVVNLKHGESTSRLIHMYPFRPDHRGAGEFIRAVRSVGDIVIAEDQLQQRWYGGPVDYWFRSTSDARKFLYRSSDGRLRDIYINSELIADPSTVSSIIARAPEAVFFVTSGETHPLRSYYLDAAQKLWLDSLEASGPALFVGSDSVTRVYCLSCTPK